MLITEFKEKKVSDYLNTGHYSNVLIIFYHGLGDTVLFYGTCYKALCNLYPHIKFTLCTGLGQEDIWGRASSDPDDYDIAFKLKFPVAYLDAQQWTKTEKCAAVELGIPYPMKEDYTLPKNFLSPLVGLHFFSTCHPSRGCPEHFAFELYDQIVESGLIPIDTHFEHCKAKECNKPYSFEAARVNTFPATLGKLYGLIRCCRGFAGSCGGNFWLASAILPENKLLFLEFDVSVSRETHRKFWSVNVTKPYDRKTVADWLDAVKEE